VEYVVPGEALQAETLAGISFGNISIVCFGKSAKQFYRTNLKIKMKNVTDYIIFF